MRERKKTGERRREPKKREGKRKTEGTREGVKRKRAGKARGGRGGGDDDHRRRDGKGERRDRRDDHRREEVRHHCAKNGRRECTRSYLNRSAEEGESAEAERSIYGMSQDESKMSHKMCHIWKTCLCHIYSGLCHIVCHR